MKFRIASDFHWEFYADEMHNSVDTETFLPVMENEKDTILLLAGDLVTVRSCFSLARFFDDLSDRFKHVYTIMGNHEHYHNNFCRTYSELRTYYNLWENITLIENDIVELSESTALYASTFWTNMNNGNKNTMEFQT